MKTPPALRPNTRHIVLLAILLFAPTAAVFAQDGLTANRSGDFSNRPTRVLAAQKTDGLVGTIQTQEVLANWDGTAENGYTLNTDPGGAVHFVQRFFFPEDGTVDGVTSCFFFDVPVVDFTFEIIVHSNSGGEPSGILADEQFFLPGTTSGDTCIDSPINLNITAASAFFGVRYPETNGVFIGVDENGPTTSAAFARGTGSEPWTEIRDFVDFVGFRNLALELLFTADSEPPPPATCAIETCVEDATTLCLLNDRFKVTADFRNMFDDAGAAGAGPEITPDTGYFHFPGDPTNVEVTAKVINGCSTELEAYWFFAAGLTDQEFTLKVCDTETGVEREYFDPLGVRFTTITDTGAFATCP